MKPVYPWAICTLCGQLGIPVPDGLDSWKCQCGNAWDVNELYCGSNNVDIYDRTIKLSSSIHHLTLHYDPDTIYGIWWSWDEIAQCLQPIIMNVSQSKYAKRPIHWNPFQLPNHLHEQLTKGIVMSVSRNPFEVKIYNKAERRLTFSAGPLQSLLSWTTMESMVKSYETHQLTMRFEDWMRKREESSDMLDIADYFLSQPESIFRSWLANQLKNPPFNDTILHVIEEVPYTNSDNRKIKGTLDLYVQTCPSWEHHKAFPVLGIELKNSSQPPRWLTKSLSQVRKYSTDIVSNHIFYDPVSKERLEPPSLVLECTPDSWFLDVIKRWRYSNMPLYHNHLDQIPHVLFLYDFAWRFATELWNRILQAQNASLLRNFGQFTMPGSERKIDLAGTTLMDRLKAPAAGYVSALNWWHEHNSPWF